MQSSLQASGQIPWRSRTVLTTANSIWEREHRADYPEDKTDAERERPQSVSGNAIALGHSPSQAWRSPHFFLGKRRFPAVNRVPPQPAEGGQQDRKSTR